jgi:iron(III) transport system substrate-binding protein
MIRSTQRVVAVLLAVVVLAACGAPSVQTPSTPASASPSSASTAASASASPSGSTAATTRPSPSTAPETATETETEEGASTAAAGEGSLTVYSGRSEALVAPIIEQFEQQTGIQVDVRYGNTTELASTILEEGRNSPADVFFAQDAGALGAVASEDRFITMPNEVLDLVNERFRSAQGEWIGVSGRARVVAYNTQAVTETDLPDTIFGFTDEQWRGRIGWAPTNASFQSFVTALRVLEGEDRAREWLEGIQANDPKAYEGNDAVMQALGTGEIDVGFVNHYYLFGAIAEQGEDFPVQNFYLTNGDPGALVNVAGVGILNTSEKQDVAQRFVEFLLGEEAQQYFADETYEYPLVNGVATNAELPPLDQIQTPQIDLSNLQDLQGTTELLQDVGVLE